MIGSFAFLTDVYFWLLLTGAIFSVWVYRLAIVERRKAVIFRQEVLYPDTSDDEDEPDYGEQLAGVQEQLNTVINAFNDLGPILEELPRRTARSMTGAHGRMTQAFTQEEELYHSGLDAVADKAMLQGLPPVMQAIGLQVAEKLDPKAMGFFRTWLTLRPEMAAHVANGGQPATNQTQNQLQAPPKVVNELDKLTGFA